MLYDDNAPSQRALITRAFLGRSGMVTLSPRPARQIWPLATSPKMNLQIKGRHFDIVEEIQCESQNVLDTLGAQDFQTRSAVTA